MKHETHRWLAAPGKPVHLTKVDPSSTEGAPGGKKQTEASFDGLLEQLDGLQERLWAEHRQSLLIVLQAMDTGGKDGTIKHVIRGMNPVGARVVSFKVPTEDELAHDFLWRIHRQTPGRGEVVVFNRSHYEDVLVVRVHKIVPESVWRPRYEQINQFEATLAAAGTRVVKFFLHISKKEQAERLRDRVDTPEKQWKFRRADLEERALWDDYQAAYAEAIEQTSTEVAPWYVIPADHKWYRNWAITEVLLGVLEEMDPKFPPGEDLAGVTID